MRRWRVFEAALVVQHDLCPAETGTLLSYLPASRKPQLKLAASKSFVVSLSATCPRAAKACEVDHMPWRRYPNPESLRFRTKLWAKALLA